jgi:DNA-binding PadR family transcriptional regulator
MNKKSLPCMPKGHENKESLLLLWLIDKRENHGYKIIQLLKNEGFSMATPARVYKRLDEMRKKGLILQREHMHGKRIRKEYSVTQKGREYFKNAKKTLFTGFVVEFLRDMIS